MLRRFVPLALLLILLAACLPAFAGCNVEVVNSIAPTDPNGTAAGGMITPGGINLPWTMPHESTQTRAADVLIFDDTAVAGGNCFSAGNSIVLTYSAQLTQPASIAAASTAYFDVYDSAGTIGLGINAQTTTSQGPGGATIVALKISVITGGTPANAFGGITATNVGSAVRVKNLRFDATKLAAGASVAVAVSATSGLPAIRNLTIANVRDTMAPGAHVVQEGMGVQNAGGTLTVPAIFDFAENYIGSFFLARSNQGGVFGDIATTATSVVFDLGTTLPVGVSVTFPAKMQVGGIGGLTLTLASGGSCTGPVQCTAVYNTTSNGASLWDVTVTTAATPNTGEDGNPPAIGVYIATASGVGDAVMIVGVIPAHPVSQTALPTPVLTMSLMGSNTISSSATPSLTSISPTSAVAGSAGATLAVSGSNFTQSSVVTWNGSPRSTTYVSATQLVTTLPPADIASAGTAIVGVLDGTAISNVASFTISASSGGGTAAPAPYILPHILSGGGYGSKISIVNTSATQNAVSVSFYGQDGSPLGSTQYSMAPGASVRIASTDAERFGVSLTKWATVTATAPVLTNVWYDLLPAMGSTAIQNSVSFNDAPPASDFSIPVEFAPAVPGVSTGTMVGLAIANPNAAPVGATIKLVNATGTVLASQVISLAAQGQTAINLSKIGAFVASLPNGNFVGSVTVSATAPVSSIAVEDSNGLFSAVPIGVGRAK